MIVNLENKIVRYTDVIPVFICSHNSERGSHTRRCDTDHNGLLSIEVRLGYEVELQPNKNLLISLSQIILPLHGSLFIHNTVNAS